MTRGTGLLENYLAQQRINLVKTIIKNHPNPQSILDIGCGKEKQLLNSLDIPEKQGTDPLIKTQLITEKKYDIITLTAVIEHLEPQEAIKLLLETKNKLNKKGLLIITTPSPTSKPLLEIMAKLNIVSKEEIEEHKKYYTQKELKETLAKAGYKQIQTGSFELTLNNYAVASDSSE